MDLRLQIGLATSFLCFAIIAVLAFAAATVGQRDALDSASSRLNLVAATLADRIDRAVSSRVALAHHLASMEALGDVWEGPPDAVRVLLARAREDFEGIAWIGYASADGVVRAAAGGVEEGRSVADEPWFRHGLFSGTVEDSSSLAPFADPGSAPEADPKRLIDIGMPIRNRAGAVIGVLGIHVSWGWADRLRKSTQGSTGGIALGVIQSDGRDVLGDAALGKLPLDRRVPLVASVRGVEPKADATGYLTGFAVTRGSAVGMGWLVVARQPAAVALAAADRVVWTIVSLGLVVGLAGILGFLVIAARVSHPFRVLADRAGVIGPDTVSRLPRVRGSSEAVRLSIALRSLVLRIGSAERSRTVAQDRAAEEAAKMNRDLAVLKNLAEVDVLTELLNRRVFMEHARTAMAQFWNTGDAFAVLMMDIDHFKRINDEFGHPAGDAVIRAIASVIGRAIRPEDKAARFGGEEFLVLIHNATTAGAREAAERIRAVVANTVIDCNGNPRAVTISIGVALSDPSDADVQALIERADVALYSAKDTGRDRVVVAPAGIQFRRHIA